MMMKYQRLAVLVRQLAAVVVNTTPGMDEPVKPTDIYITAFDDLDTEPVQVTPPERWGDEKARLMKLFEKIEHGKN